jgi:hypothetical protein
VPRLRRTCPAPHVVIPSDARNLDARTSEIPRGRSG